MFGLMTKRPKKPEEVSELWRDLCEKVLGELSAEALIWTK